MRDNPLLLTQKTYTHCLCKKMEPLYRSFSSSVSCKNNHFQKFIIDSFAVSIRQSNACSESLEPAMKSVVGNFGQMLHIVQMFLTAQKSEVFHDRFLQ